MFVAGMAISVPFKWEEAPGKPKPMPINMETLALQLPPRLQQSSSYRQGWFHWSPLCRDPSPFTYTRLEPSFTFEGPIPLVHPYRSDINFENVGSSTHHDSNESILLSPPYGSQFVLKIINSKRVIGCDVSPFKLLKYLVRTWRSIRGSKSKRLALFTSQDMWSPTLATYFAIVLDEQHNPCETSPL